MANRAPVVIDLKFSVQDIAAALEGLFAGRQVLLAGDAGADLAAARYAIVWKPGADLFARAPGLQVLFSGGAGVDHILSLPHVPEIPIVRFVDDSLTTRMSEWVVLQALSHLRQVPAYLAQQRQRLWRELPQPQAGDVTVGVMGLGVLGQDAVRKLQHIGFNVIGWSRGPKAIDGVETFDASGLDAFLARSDILVGLLPLTQETRGLYDAALFSKLRQGGALSRPVFINAGRGGSQVESDLVAALESGVLGGASLDVFAVEPLDESSPLWAMDNVIITPHAASSTDARILLASAEAQILAYEAGEPLANLVERGRGY